MISAATSGFETAQSGGERAERPPTVSLLLFAAARLAAGTTGERVPGWVVSDVLGWAKEKYGADFAAVLDRSRVWVNGSPATDSHPLSEGDEVAVLPPVSGGSW